MEQAQQVLENQWNVAADCLACHPAVMPLMSVLSKDDAVVEQVVALLRLEPDLVEEVLRLANSLVCEDHPYIRSLSQAILELGTRRVKALIATASLCRAPGNWSVA